MKNSRKILGVDFHVSKINVKDLPIYITSGREFYKLSFSGVSFVLVMLSSDEKFGVIAFEKQAKLISEEYGLPVAFEFENISRSQRDSLIDRSIPFIAGSEQLFLPFLGIFLSDRFIQQKTVSSQKMMPATQALFLYLLYNSKDGAINKKEAAKRIGITQMSITRASDQLTEMGLIAQETQGKETFMRVIGEGKQLFEKARPFMISPIQKMIITSAKKLYASYPLSGESALAERTMLTEPQIHVRAVYKKDIDADELSEVDIRWEPEKEVVCIELWKYDPCLFAKDGIVDPISLAMCFEDNEDERIEGMMKEYLEEYQW